MEDVLVTLLRSVNWVGEGLDELVQFFSLSCVAVEPTCPEYSVVCRIIIFYFYASSKHPSRAGIRVSLTERVEGENCNSKSIFESFN